MPKLSVFLPFLLIMLSVMGASHALVWWRLVRQTQLPLWLSLVATCFLITGLIAVPLALALGRRLPSGVDAAMYGAYVYLGFFFYLFLASAASALLHFALTTLPAACLPNFVTAAPYVDVARALGVVVVLSAGAATAFALASVGAGPYVVQVEVPLARLPAALDGLRVVQVSDLHVASLLKRPYVEKVVSRALALSPDVVVLTGDLVDGSVPKLAHDIAPLAKLVAPLGSYVITGNHEYYSGADAWLRHLVSLGIRPLRNERVALQKGGSSLDLAGIDDWTAHNFGHGHGANLPAALAGRDAERCLILLAHQPRAADEAQAAGVDLMLSGHTHGGQLWPFGYAVRLVQPFLRGLSRYRGMWVYVNPGTGYWGPPMRLGAPAEITLLILRHAPQLEK